MTPERRTEIVVILATGFVRLRRSILAKPYHPQTTRPIPEQAQRISGPMVARRNILAAGTTFDPSTRRSIVATEWRHSPSRTSRSSGTEPEGHGLRLLKNQKHGWTYQNGTSLRQRWSRPSFMAARQAVLRVSSSSLKLPRNSCFFSAAKASWPISWTAAPGLIESL